MDFVSRDFSQYAWSLRTLDRRLHHFQICHTDRNVTVDEVEAAVKKELEGPGKLLGYRALHKKIRQVYDLNVLRDLVYAVMYINREFKIRRLRTTNYGWTSVVVCL